MAQCTSPVPCCAAEVEWAIQHGSRIDGSVERAVRENFPEYTSRRLAHWKRAYYTEKWYNIPASMAAKISQTPNWWRKRNGLRLKGPSASHYTLPENVEKILLDQVQHLVRGDADTMPRRDPVTKSDVASTMAKMCEEFNKEVADQSLQADLSLLPTVQSYAFCVVYSIVLYLLYPHYSLMMGLAGFQ